MQPCKFTKTNYMLSMGEFLADKLYLNKAVKTSW